MAGRGAFPEGEVALCVTYSGFDGQGGHTLELIPGGEGGRYAVRLDGIYQGLTPGSSAKAAVEAARPWRKRSDFIDVWYPPNESFDKTTNKPLRCRRWHILKPLLLMLLLEPGYTRVLTLEKRYGWGIEPMYGGGKTFWQK